MTEKNVIDIRDATVYLDDEPVLKSVNWQVKAGEHWFILGANGAGKTTLVKLLMGFVWAAYGARVEVLGELYGKTNLVELRKRIAWVSPFIQRWLSDKVSALDVVLSGIDATLGGLFREPRPEEVERVRGVMRSLDCERLAEHSFAKLSSGEQLKMLIARALVSRPEMLILDEACVHLDLKSREFLLETVDGLAKSEHAPTIIFITQRIEDIIPAFGRGLIIRDGKVLAAGRGDDILTEENLYRTFDLRVRLHRTKSGRYWSRIDEN